MSCSSSARPESTASISPIASRPRPSSTSSTAWCRCSRNAGSSNARTSRTRYVNDCSAGPVSRSATRARSFATWPSASRPRPPPTEGNEERTGASADAPAPVARTLQHFVERFRRVEAWLARQPEHALADAVALHLVGAGGDRDHASIEIVDGGLAGIVVTLRPCQRLGSAYFEGKPSPDRVVHACGQLAVGGHGVVG